MPKLIELNVAAEMLGITPDKLMEMRDSGEIGSIRDTSGWKFKLAEIDRVKSSLGSTPSSGSDDLLSLDDAEMFDVADLNLDEDNEMVDVADLDLDDETADGDDSVLVTEDELGRSDDSTSSTVIGRPDENVSESEGDIKLADDELAESLMENNADLTLGTESSPELSIEDEQDLSLSLDDEEDDLNLSSAGKSDVLTSDSDLLSFVEDEPSGVGKAKPSQAEDDLGGSSLTLADDDKAKQDDDELSLDDDELSLDSDSAASGIGLDSAIDLDLDDDELSLSSGSGSDVPLGASDSGINSANPADSGISLESAPDDLGSGIDLQFNDEIELESQPTNPEEVTELSGDSDFMLTPVSGEGGLDEESDESGSQVIALESDEFDESEATLLAGNEESPLIADNEFVAEDLDESVAPAMSAAAVAPATVEEADFSVWNIVSLSMLAVVMSVGSLLVLDIIRNIWSWDQPYSLSSTLMDLIVGS